MNEVIRVVTKIRVLAIQSVDSEHFAVLAVDESGKQWDLFPKSKASAKAFLAAMSSEEPVFVSGVMPTTIGGIREAVVIDSSEVELP